MWDKTEGDLYAAAIANMEEDTVFDKLPNIFPEQMLPEETLNEKVPMYLLTNTENYYGAVELVDEDILRKISAELGDFIMLPSSTHEWFLLKDDGTADYEELVGMVREINELYIEPEERLSDHVYVYKQADGEVKRAA